MSITTQEQCWSAIVDVITAVLDDLGEEPGDITADTMLNADLGISSVEAIHIMILLEEKVSKPLSFESFAIRDGEYVEDLSVGELYAYVTETLNLQKKAG